MKKIRLTIIGTMLVCVLGLSSCMGAPSVPTIVAEQYYDLAKAYIADRYNLADTDYSTFSVTTGSFNDNMGYTVTCRTKDEDGFIFHIINVGTDAIYDDYEYCKFNDAAYDYVTARSAEIFGKDIKINAIQHAYTTNKLSPISANVQEYLANNKTEIFGLAVAGGSALKDTDLESFSKLLNELNFDATYGLFYYDNYSDIQDKFTANKAFAGIGKFYEHCVITNNDLTNVKWLGKGKSETESSNTNKPVTTTVVSEPEKSN